MDVHMDAAVPHMAAAFVRMDTAVAHVPDMAAAFAHIDAAVAYMKR